MAVVKTGAAVKRVNYNRKRLFSVTDFPRVDTNSVLSPTWHPNSHTNKLPGSTAKKNLKNILRNTFKKTHHKSCLVSSTKGRRRSKAELTRNMNTSFDFSDLGTQRTRDDDRVRFRKQNKKNLYISVWLLYYRRVWVFVFPRGATRYNVILAIFSFFQENVCTCGCVWCVFFLWCGSTVAYSPRFCCQNTCS